MTTRVAALAVAITRMWLRVYTARMPPSVAARRRAEIESDVWEMQQDPDLVSGITRVWIFVARLIAGIPDDLAWRFDNAATEHQIIVRRLLAMTAATLVLLSLWAAPSLLLNGRREVAACAAGAPPGETDADLRLELMRCVGAFFTSAR